MKQIIRRAITCTCSRTLLLVSSIWWSFICYIYLLIYDLEHCGLDFDGAEPGTTNEESENLRR